MEETTPSQGHEPRLQVAAQQAAATAAAAATATGATIGNSPHSMVFDVANWQPKPVKRPRPVKSCTECRRRKLRCDRRCPCSQCQRSYRLCEYGGNVSSSGSGSGGGSGTGIVEFANQPANDPSSSSAVDAANYSEGSEGSEQEDDPADGAAGEGRPSKRISSRQTSASAAQQSPLLLSSTGGRQLTPPPPPPPAPPPLNSSLSLLLNPPSPAATHSSSLPAAAQALPSTSASAPASAPASASSHTFKSSFMGANSPLLTLNGNELRQFTSALIDEFSARMERLEKMVLDKNMTALSAMPPFPSSSMLSQLHTLSLPQSEQPCRHIIDPSSTTLHCLTVKGPQGLRTRFLGHNSTRVLLHLFDEAKGFISDRTRRDTASDMFSRLETIYTALQEEHRQALKPITVYVDSMMPVQKRMADILPRRQVCDRLIDAYVSTAEGLYRVVHVPTFRQEYDAYWESRAGGGGGNTATITPTIANTATAASTATTRPPYAEDFLPRLLCMMCIGSRFETDSKGLCYDRSDGVHIPTACALVRTWLDGVRERQQLDVTILQTELLLLQSSRMIAPRTQSLWMELGLISRMAMALGLHRDPSEFGSQMPPFQAECRRKLWFTILDMDLHVSLACSLPNALRPDEFSCQAPSNLDDADVYPEMASLPPSRPLDQYTDCQMQAYAAGTVRLRMRANQLLCHIDSLQDYGEVLAVGGELEKALDDINCLFPRNALLSAQKKFREWRMRALLDMHVRRPLLGLYRPFALSASPEHPPPAAITDVYLKSSMAMLTYMEEVNPTDVPEFAYSSHMYYIILRHDILQAAFSVCFYIKQAVEAEAAAARGPIWGGEGGGDGGGEERAAGAITTTATTMTSMDNSGSPPPPASDRDGNDRPRLPLWSSDYMIRTVERTIVNLARLAGDLNIDLRDVVALAVALGSVQPATSTAQRDTHIRAQVGRTLETCAQTLRDHSSSAVGEDKPNELSDKRRNQNGAELTWQVRAAVLGPDMPPLHIPHWYSRPPLLADENRGTLEDEANSDAGFWDIWPGVHADG